MNALVVTLMLVCSTSVGLFDGPALRRVQIEIASENVERLRAEPRQPVPAQLQFEEGPTETISLRLKGRGSFQPVDQKPSLTITGTETPTKFHLNNSIEDPTYLKEIVGSELFRSAGIPAPNVTHARVKLNGRELGLYVLKEGFTQEFLDRSFSDPKGRLYDTDSGNDVDQPMELDLGDRSASRSELKELAAAASETNLEKRFERMAAILDVEQFLTFLATEVLLCHWDGYALSKNNFRIYFAPQHDRIRFLPAGLDQIFAKADLPWNTPMAGSVAKALLETQLGEARYETEFRRPYNSFSPERISTQIRNHLTELRPFLTSSEFNAFSAEAEDLIRSIHARKLSLESQLSQRPAAIPKFENGTAIITGWHPFDPSGGKLSEDESALRIIAGPKTFASWRATILLKPGDYRLSSDVQTSDVEPMTFGERHGASLRIFGKDAQSTALLGTAQQTLACNFEVECEQEVTLICELRGRSGKATFAKPVTLRIKEKK